MNRRNFLKLGAASGLALVAAPAIFRGGARAAEPYTGPFFVHLHAAGGWDPTYFCDPKTNPAYVKYTAIGTEGPFSYADIPFNRTAMGLDETPGIEPYLMTNKAFFQKYATKVRVINGIDTATNNHDVGVRAAGSGKMTEGYPSFGALTAAAHGGNKALSYISGGGYDVTMGLVAATRLSASGYTKVANPFDSDAARPTTAPYHREAAQDAIRAAQAERMQQLTASEHLPRVKSAIGALERARIEDGELKSLVIPTFVDIPGNQLGDSERMLQQMQLALAAFDAGLAVSASVALTGFDTHSNHDQAQSRQIAKLLAGIDFLFEQAALLGIADLLTLVVTADFGRGPIFNVTAGKDHWPVTSALLMGRGITAGLVGATDDAVRPTRVNPNTLAQDPNGVRITFEHLHHSLRALAGVADSPEADRFPIGGTPLPLLG